MGIKFFLTTERLQEFLDDGENSLPAPVTELLVRHGFLGGGNDNLARVSAVAREFEAGGERAVDAAMAKLAKFCVTRQGGDFSDGSLLAFLDYSTELERAGIQNTHTMAAALLRKVVPAALTPTEALLLAKAQYEESK